MVKGEGLRFVWGKGKETTERGGIYGEFGISSYQMGGEMSPLPPPPHKCGEPIRIVGFLSSLNLFALLLSQNPKQCCHVTLSLQQNILQFLNFTFK